MNGDGVRSVFIVLQSQVWILPRDENDLPASMLPMAGKNISADSSIILEFIALCVKARGDGPFVL